jgi:hypothetical protein
MTAEKLKALRTVASCKFLLNTLQSCFATAFTWVLLHALLYCMQMLHNEQVFKFDSVVSAVQGATTVAVINSPKTLLFTGFGVSPGDSIRWLISGNDCTDTLAIAPLLSTADNTAVLAADVSATFTLSADVFINGDAPSGTTVAQPLTLCYQFASEPFWHVAPAVTTSAHHVTHWDSSTGSAQFAVVGVAEELTLAGYGITAQDELRFILSGTDCADASVAVATVEGGAGGTASVTAGGVTTVTFTAAAAGQTPMLCYKVSCLLYVSRCLNK